VKVGFGAELPLKKEYAGLPVAVHGEGGVGGIRFPESRLEPDPREAWELIYEEAVRLKGELLLFAVGPLTNIAIALRKHPDLPKYI
ncbi:MAG: nucleoside hydrolase, partial [Eubacteriales bacterium]|nr:nucleoside hydrolase [Eubacteriales bacterium]